MKLNEVISESATKTVYRDGDKIIKIFDADYSKADVLNEALNQARVEETEVNIPKVLEVTKFDGKWAIVREYIPGKTLDQLMAENPDKQEEYLDLFVNVQMKIHAQKCMPLSKLKDKMRGKIAMADVDDTIRYELQTRLEGMPTHDKVCHGDFNPSNVIITDSGIPYVIDWSHATQGNASADVARTYLLFCLQNKRELADRYLDVFCEKSNTEKKYIQKWLPIVAASQSVKGKPEEREFLHSWVDVAEYQ